MKRDLLIIMTKYTLILAPLEVFAKRTFLGQGPETAALPDPEQWMPATFCRASILYIDLSFKHQASSFKRQAATSLHMYMKNFICIMQRNRKE